MAGFMVNNHKTVTEGETRPFVERYLKLGVFREIKRRLLKIVVAFFCYTTRLKRRSKVRVVVKFGGTSVGNAERIRLAARSIAKQVKKGNQIIVVVSAMAGVTDNLLDTAKSATGENIDDTLLSDIVSMGEATSARIMTATLKSMGIESRYFDPNKKDFPIITDNTPWGAKILPKQSIEAGEKYLEPLLERGIVPVVCGFLGKSLDGKVTTLGRGGSDTTAYALGNFLNADWVIIVTDADGVLSGDPRKVEGAKILKEISVKEMGVLADRGAKVIHPNALRFKTPKMRSKVIHFRHGDLDVEGTEIVGYFEKRATLHKEKLSMVTIVGDEIMTTPGLLDKIISPLAEKNIGIYGVSVGTKYIGIYVETDNSSLSYNMLHPIVVSHPLLKSITVKDSIGLISTESQNFIDTPGIISKLTTPLGEAGINILEMSTIKTDILIYVDWDRAGDAYEIISHVMEEIP